MGSTTRKFEEEIENTLEVRHCVATGSGTTALLMALIATGIQSQDIVAIQDRSWISAAHVAHLLDTRIVLIDVELQSPVVDKHAMDSVFSLNPKCVILIHMNGRSNFIQD